jgi:hypothetical protein
MPSIENTTIQARHPDPRTVASVVPFTPAELAAASGRWERRGLLQRLVRCN